VGSCQHFGYEDLALSILENQDFIFLPLQLCLCSASQLRSSVGFQDFRIAVTTITAAENLPLRHSGGASGPKNSTEARFFAPAMTRPMAHTQRGADGPIWPPLGHLPAASTPHPLRLRPRIR